MRTLKYGGVLHLGDFIAVSNGNYISFGWYVGDGRGTLQYYPMRAPGIVYNEYRAWSTLNDVERAKNKWLTRRYEKGFTMKCLWKSYINCVHDTRVMKITNPEEIFTEQEDIELYEKSKEALIMLKFIEK